MKRALDTETLRSVYDRSAGRYDWMHRFFTAGSDDRGRRLLVDMTVRAGDHVLDAGGGTGITAVYAAQKVGHNGKVIILDISEGMLERAGEKVAGLGLEDVVELRTGDILNLPFEDESFDVVLSTYSLCPVYDPERGIRELYRVLKRGGLLGVAHSAEPDNPLLRWLSGRIESIVWRFPFISLGCRAIDVLPYLKEAGVEVVFERRTGVPLWPFKVFVVRKPDKSYD